MGRPRKVIELNRKHFTKAERAQRQKSEEAFKVGREEMKAPEYLSEQASKEFERIKEEAYWLDDLDVSELSYYCFCSEKAASIMKSYGNQPEVLRIPGNDGTLKIIGNPLRKALRDYESEMRAISSKLGLTTIDRLRLIAPKEENATNRYLELIRSK